MDYLEELQNAMARSLDELSKSLEALRALYEDKAKEKLPELEGGLNEMQEMVSIIKDHIENDALKNMGEDELIEYSGVISNLNQQALAMKETLERMMS